MLKKNAASFFTSFNGDLNPLQMNAINQTNPVMINGNQMICIFIIMLLLIQVLVL